MDVTKAQMSQPKKSKNDGKNSKVSKKKKNIM